MVSAWKNATRYENKQVSISIPVCKTPLHSPVLSHWLSYAIEKHFQSSWLHKQIDALQRYKISSLRYEVMPSRLSLREWSEVHSLVYVMLTPKYVTRGSEKKDGITLQAMLTSISTCSNNLHFKEGWQDKQDTLCSITRSSPWSSHINGCVSLFLWPTIVLEPKISWHSHFVWYASFESMH